MLLGGGGVLDGCGVVWWCGGGVLDGCGVVWWCGGDVVMWW